MKFTLSLHDYLDQYTVNRSEHSTHCPVCYEQVLTMDMSDDVKHVFGCYKEELLLRLIVQFRKQHGHLPEIDIEFINIIDEHVTQQLINYCESYRNLVTHLVD